MDEAGRLLVPGFMLTLTGTAGLGKTRIAQRIALVTRWASERIASGDHPYFSSLARISPAASSVLTWDEPKP
jgi:hypothetical protein